MAPPTPTTRSTAPGLHNSAPDNDASAGKYQGMLVPTIIRGARDPKATIDVILGPGYTKVDRSVSKATKADIGRRDGVCDASDNDSVCLGKLKGYEIDHYLALIQGGANSTDNLWAQPPPQWKIKDVFEVHGRMFLKANPTAEALQQLQDATLNGSWINAAVTVVDPFLLSQGKAKLATMLHSEAKTLFNEKNYKLAATAYHELSTLYTPKPQRSADTPRAFMSEVELNSAPDAKKWDAAAAVCEARAKAQAGGD